MSTMARRDKEQELSHILLIELLTYQFCSPVQWIQTQDFVLHEYQAEKILEIGPSDTLINMAKRTRDSKYKTHDIANSVHREFLSFKHNKEKIYYSWSGPEKEVEKLENQQAPPQPETKLEEALPVHSATTIAETRIASSIPDIPVDVSTILKVIVCRGLKKQISEDMLGKSIGSLCGGRSTIQNEIIGDLDKEFGNLPESPEDIPLDKLCSFLQGNFVGGLGRCSKAMVDRMIASKMPGGFNLTIIREYLKSEWGFENGRQDAILLSAINAQPPSHIDTEDLAKSFWATISQSYIAEKNLTVATPSTGSDGTSNQGMQVDPRAIQALQKEQRKLHQQLMDVYAKQLNLDDVDSGSVGAFKLGESPSDLQSDLNSWVDEHGLDYAVGIQQKFDPKKIRIYDSSWNWAAQDLLVIYHDLISGKLEIGDEKLVQQQLLLINKCTPRLVDMMKYLLSVNLPKQIKPRSLLAQWLSEVILDGETAMTTKPSVRLLELPTAPHTIIEADGNVHYFESIRPEPINISDLCSYKKLDPEIATISLSTDSDTSSTKSDSLVSREGIGLSNDSPLFIEVKDAGLWKRSVSLTNQYFDTLKSLNSTGLSFRDRNVLITGAGKGSIGAAILQRLLIGGARVIVTTSSYSSEVTKYYQNIFSEFGASGSLLMVLPFNQGSRQDVEALINHIYSLGDNEWDLDHVIPFAAISEHTQGLDDINSKTELAHRIMLTNTLRLLGAIKKHKAAKGITTRPAQVILPLSPNHGVFGNDGLYAESKIGLETLMQKWHSEDWGEYLSITGTVIGWTRGTALMVDNDIVSEGIEKLGVRTFSQSEMAYNILGLMTDAVLEASQLEPLIADLSGGMSLVPNLKKQVIDIRKQISETSACRKAFVLEEAAARGQTPHSQSPSARMVERANLKFDFPRLPDYASEIEPLDSLQGMVDLERVVVVTGFAEVGPYGNSRTRWEMEAYGEFSLEGCIEMAWIMGLIEYDTVESKSYSGWVDKKTRQPINDIDVKLKYEQYILDHTGIRIIEPRVNDGPDVKSKQFLHEIVIQDDLAPFEASKETAQSFLKEHGVKVKIAHIEGSDRYQITLRRGARLMVPKALKLTGFVGGQVPSGWDAETYGISKDIINQVDPATLYALVCTVEALLSAGITDPYELYKYIHVSELGCCIGSGMGGITSQQNMYRERFLDQPVANDVLAEGFINTGSAWINMLLLSSSGPNITPVGACATSIESMSVGFDLITTGKAKTVLVGGYDWISKDTSYEFANMKATINAEEDMACGRSPKEMSRPTASSRKGFVESEGCGIQVLTTAKLALEMGLPIHGVVALAHTAFDKSGRSLPAPGQGIVTTSRETQTKFGPPLLSMAYRRRCISLRMAQINETETSELSYLQAELSSYGASEVDFDIVAYEKSRLEAIRSEATRQVRETLNIYGNDFWKADDRIAPIRGALATWGLTINDLDVASFHGTSTVKNEINESEVIHKQLTHLGRKAGNPILGVCQKSLTGHPKGAAGAWMFNGGLQMLDTGLVPGNRNADNIDSKLEKYDSIVFPNRNIQKSGGVKAFSVTSFGFGQKGAQAIGIHPKYLFAALPAGEYEAYCEKVGQRQKLAYQYIHNGLVNKSLFIAKDKPPYSKDEETSFLCNASARLPMGM